MLRRGTGAPVSCDATQSRIASTGSSGCPLGQANSRTCSFDSGVVVVRVMIPGVQQDGQVTVIVDVADMEPHFRTRSLLSSDVDLEERSSIVGRRHLSRC